MSVPLYLLGFFYFSLITVLLLHLPALIDGLSQLAGRRESNNALRFVTGLLMGVGNVGLAAHIGWFLRIRLLGWS